MLNSSKKWWVKPEFYPKVCPEHPPMPDPFKVSAEDTKFLHRKLSSGAKKAQRGYPLESRIIAGKITDQAAPSLADATMRVADKPFRQHTGATFKFMPSEPREILPGTTDSNTDGYEFTQPLYSSFTADRTFVPPKLPPRAHQRARPAMRERVRPASTQASCGMMGSSMPANTLPPTSHGGTMGSMRPVTAAVV
uniref:Uncharacterized protein n=1 Tax=Haptolina brevifila TaxID=156173 RepID=A0A7S2BLS4_9EUKA|mmetsp:Transcript_14253/g.28690  ORF Transcript_14253/g.28690 Transcript_14253/m.28690 type:complete len:194 (+) Transcript_14253:1-582(+)